MWLQFEDLAAHASVRYEAAVLRLDERHVASQQRRLLAFVSSALGDKVGVRANPDPNPNPNPNPNPKPNPNRCGPPPMLDRACKPNLAKLGHAENHVHCF